MKSHKWIWLLCLFAMLVFAGCGDDDDDDDNGTSTDDDDNDDTSDDDDNDTGSDDDDDDDDDDDNDDNDDDTVACDEQTHDALVAQGKTYLADYNAQDAYGAFYDALYACPPSGEARFGMLVADSQWFMTWLKRWVDYLGNYNPQPHDDKGVGTTFQAIAEYQLLPVAGEMASLADQLISDFPDETFSIDNLPLWLDENDETILDFAGQWDRYDVANAKAFARFWGFFCRFMIAFDLDFDWSIFALNPAPTSPTTEELIHFYAGLLLEILAEPNHPDFLTFMPGGDESLALSGINAGLALKESAQAFSDMLTATDDQTDDLAGYVDENGNSQWDEGEPYLLPYYGALSPDDNGLFLEVLASAEVIGNAFVDGSEFDEFPLVPNLLWLNRFNPILEFFDLSDSELPPIPLPVGSFFSSPPADGLRGYVQTLAQLLYDATTP